MRRQLWSVSLTILLTTTGAPVASQGVAAAAATHPRRSEPLPLERLFDNRAVSDDAQPASADFDGAGHSLSAGDLDAAGWQPGRRLDLDGALLRWPGTGPGRADNVRAAGQRVALSGTGDALSFLVAGTSPGGPGPSASGEGRISYSDGSSSTYSLDAPDWRGGPLATKAVALPHLNSHDGGRLQESAKLYAVTVPVVPGRALSSVTLPDGSPSGPALHVFAMSLRSQEGPGGGGSGAWSGSWAAATSGYTAVGPWQDQTLRLVVHSTAGSSPGDPGVRIRLANTFADGPVTLGHASIAVRGQGASARERPVPLRFGGGEGTVLPAGAQAVSDPASLTVPPDSDLLVSLHLPGPVSAAPVHSETRQTSYVSAQGSGDRTGDTDGGAFTGSLAVWPFLTGVEVHAGPGSVVALGDSITDGTHSTEGADRRWPDDLSRRILARQDMPHYGVLDEGISANRVVTDRYPGDGVSTDTGGVSAGHRLERDVLAQPSARVAVVFEGVNDVRAGTSAADVVAGLRDIAARARARGLRVVAATVTPCGGYQDCTPQVEERRTAVNSFIRNNGGTFDATADFDAAVRDPADPQRMLPAYDSGDHLHPGDAGLQALADTVDLHDLVP